MRISGRFAASLWIVTMVAGGIDEGFAQLPDHPIVTEVFTDPPGDNDGPVGRILANPHQEYIEIYLPPAGVVDPNIDAESLDLAFYEVEGDSNSSGVALVNYRFDLPTFDLNPGNGVTDGAIARPSSGIVVLGWVDYVGDPPTGLFGTPNTRRGLINGGIDQAPQGYVFVAINGNHFGGTTNFPVVVAESLIDVPSETRSGIIQNGSAAYLLVDRESPGYAELFDDKHVPIGESADPNLAGGNVLMTTALFDGYAANDDADFDVLLQPYDSPTNNECANDITQCIDLETVLPLGGAFSMLLPQIAEEDVRPTLGTGNGYARVFVNVAKTTENGQSDDPVEDALNAYRVLRNSGPFYPTPGRAALTSSAPELSVAQATEQVFDVLTETTGRPGILCANVGGNFLIDITAVPGGSDDPPTATFATGPSDVNILGQSFGFPTIEATPGASAAHGASASTTVTVTATNVNGGDPPVQAPVQQVSVTATVLKPTTGQDAGGQPFQTTVFLAVQGVVANQNVANELLNTDLGAFLVAELGDLAQESLGNAAVLLDPGTDISDGLIAGAMIESIPTDPLSYIDAPGPGGLPSLVQTVLTSAEVASNADTYTDSFDEFQTVLKAISVNIPDTRTFGGTFSPSENVHFADAKGFVADPRSGLTQATTTRTFEMVIVDTQVNDAGDLETGATDDFGVILEVADTEVDSPVVAGEFVFLSFMGGLQGADIDTLELPSAARVVNLIYLDLDNLHDVLGVRSIERAFVVDADGNGEVDVIEIFSLNPAAIPPASPFDSDHDGDVDLDDLASFSDCVSGPGNAHGVGCQIHDDEPDGDVDIDDFDAFQIAFTGSL